MDIDPTNFDKKDHIFMEFFSMYGKNFIGDKRQDQQNQKRQTFQQPKSVPLQQ